jgi:hypothetical protein
MTMPMAMASRTSRANPEDPRLPCPVCEQPVHPVAGRCKHCKTDLVKLREQRGQRAARLDPAQLGAAARPVAPASPFAPAQPVAPPAATNGHRHPLPPGAALGDGSSGAHPPVYAPVPVPAPVGHGTAVAEGTDWARRWPVLALIVAAVAIAISAYLLLFGGDDDPGVTRAPGSTPAPHRMETMPALPMPGTPPPPPPPAAAVPDLDDDLAGGVIGGTLPDDPWAPPPRPGPRGAPSAEDFWPQMSKALCQKLTRCGASLQGGIDLCSALDDPTITDMQREMVRNGRCTYDQARAARCLEAIDRIQCDGDDVDAMDLLSTFGAIPDCVRALDCS